MAEAAFEWHRLGAWRAIGAALIAAIVVLSLVPPSEVPGTGLLPDKLAHVLAYAALMGWHVQLAGRGASRRRAYAAAFLLLGVALEAGQAVTGYRTFEALDILANGAGIGLGWYVSARWCPEALRRIDEMLA